MGFSPDGDRTLYGITNGLMTWSINLYEGLRPTRGRYRGHHASKMEYGREPDGQTYRPSHARPGLDADVGLFDRDSIPTYTPGLGVGRWLSAWETAWPPSHRLLNNLSSASCRP